MMRMARTSRRLPPSRLRCSALAWRFACYDPTWPAGPFFLFAPGRSWLHRTWVRKIVERVRCVADILQQLGMPLPHIAAWLTIGAEVLGASPCCLARLWSGQSIPTAWVSLVAMATVHLWYEFCFVKLLSVTASGAQFGPVGYELDLLYLAALLVIVLQGPGPLSIDRLRRQRSTT